MTRSAVSSGRKRKRESRRKKAYERTSWALWLTLGKSWAWRSEIVANPAIIKGVWSHSNPGIILVYSVVPGHLYRPREGKNRPHNSSRGRPVCVTRHYCSARLPKASHPSVPPPLSLSYSYLLLLLFFFLHLHLLLVLLFLFIFPPYLPPSPLPPSPPPPPPPGICSELTQLARG